MLILYPQGTSLSLQKAHWIQILHSACALARKPGVRVVLIPRTASPENLESLQRELGEALPPGLTIEPLVDYASYKRQGITGDLLSEHQKFLTRLYGRKRFGQIVAQHTKEKDNVLLFTRDQEIPEQCHGTLAKLKPIMINELHKFEYVNRLQGKMTQNKEKPLALRKYREFARKEKMKEMRFLNHFHGVVCTTDNLVDLMIRSGFRKPLLTIPNGTPLLETVTPQEAVSRNRDLDLLYVGQLYRWKNVDLLLKALALLPDRTLTIIGGKPETEDWVRLHQLAESLGVSNRVTFLGHQPHGLIAGFMQRARLGVVPLPQTGFPEARLFCCPLKAIELMAAGTPMIASDLRSVRGMLTHRKNAYLVKPDQAEALAAGIREVLEDSHVQEQLILGGLVTARELSYDERARHILEFAQELRQG